MKKLLLYIWLDIKPFLICAVFIYTVVGWWWMAYDIRAQLHELDAVRYECFEAQRRADGVSLRLLDVETRQFTGESLWTHNPVQAAHVSARHRARGAVK